MFVTNVDLCFIETFYLSNQTDCLVWLYHRLSVTLEIGRPTDEYVITFPTEQFYVRVNQEKNLELVIYKERYCKQIVIFKLCPGVVMEARVFYIYIYQGLSKGHLGGGAGNR